MSGSTVPSSASLWWSTRRSRDLLLALHVPFLLVGPLTTVVGIADPPRDVWLVLALAVPVAALQARHSLAAASGIRPSWWPVTLTALGLLAFVPLPWFGADWASVAWFFISSTAMFLTGPRRKVMTVLPILGIPIWLGITAGLETPRSVSTGVWAFLYWSVGISSGSLCLYAATRLVRAVDELFATRAELAESVVGRERVRLSRDLHDLLGQSLSAVSLKGDLALELLRGGSADAAAEGGSGIPGLTERAQALAGSVTAGHLADGRFRLRVQVPSAGTIT